MSGHPRAVAVSVLLLFLIVSTTGISPLRPPIVEDSDGNKADEKSKITWATNNATVKYKLDGDAFSPGSLEALFNMANGFIDVVMPKDVPYDLLLDVKAGEFNQETQDTLVKMMMGYAICLAIGILLALCVPFVGCCFCCCRCCGNCGGKRVQAKPSAGRCWCYTITLVVCCAMTCCGACLMLKVNENAKSTGDSIEEIGLDNLDDLATFLDTSAKDLKFIGVGGFRFVGKVVMRDLDNMDILVGEKVVDNLENKGHAKEAINKIIDFDQKVKDVDSKMEKLHNDEIALQTKGDELITALKDRKDALEAISCSNCAIYFNTSKLAMDADYTALPNIYPQVLIVDAVANNDPSLAASANQGMDELNDIPKKVLNDSQAQRNDVRKLLDDFVNTVSNQTANIEELQKTLDVPDKKKQLSDAISPVSSGNKYSWYGGIGLGGMLLLIVLLQVVGLALGMCGYSSEVHPEDRSGASNTGGNCLMASVALTFFFFALFMIFLILLFMLGVPAQKLLCDPLMDPEFTAMDTLLDGERGLLHKDGYFLGDLLLQNKSVKLTFKQVLSDCRDNKPSYSALRLDSKFNLDEMANYADKIDFNDTMSKVEVNLSSVALLSDTTEVLLRNFSRAVSELNYQGFRDELEKNTTMAGKDLGDFIQGVENAASDIANSAVESDLRTEVTELKKLNDGLLKKSTEDQAALLRDVNTLNGTTKDIPSEVDDMISSTKKAEKYIHDEGSDMVKMVTQSLVDRILSTANQFTEHLLSSVKEDLMRCKPIWNLWKSIVHDAVCGYGVQTLNGFWFALGWSVFFLFIGMIFSVKTAKYFHKMTGAPPPFPSAKVGHYDGGRSSQ